MTTDGHVDRVLHRWLSEGSSIAPDRVINAALAQVPTTRQRGAGWLLRRSTSMTTVARGAQAPQARRLIGLAAVVALAFVGLRLVGGVNIGGADPALGDGVIFTSERYGYSVTVPADFERFEIPGTWAAGESPVVNGPGSDVYSGPGSIDVRTDMVVWSQAVGTETSLDAFLADYDALMSGSAGSCSGILTTGPLTIGGESARFTTHECPDGAGTVAFAVHEAVVLHGERAYVIALAAPPASLSDAERGDLFESILATFSFSD